MRYLATLVAVLALLLTACAEGDPGASPAGTGLDLNPIFSPGGTGDDSGASPGATGGDDAGGASPGATGVAGATGSPAATGSPGATDDDDGASPTGSPSPGTGTGTGTADACEEAFDDVPELSRIDSLRQLQEAIAALDATIEACDSVTEWTDQASEQLNLGNIGLDAESFLRERCNTDALEDTVVCREL